MFKNSKTYIHIIIIVLFILLGSIFAFNYIFDPLNLFNKKNNYSNSNSKLFYEKVINSKYGVYIDEKKFSFRDIKEYFALNSFNKDCAVIGSSVVDMINSNVTNKDKKKLRNLDSYCNSILNLSVPQSVYEDYFAFSYMLLQNPYPPKKIILNIDPYSFSKFNYFWDYFEEEYYSMYNLVFDKKNDKKFYFNKSNKFKRFLENSFSLKYFIISFKKVFLSQNFLPEEAEYFDPEMGSEKIHVIFSDGSGVTERKAIDKKDYKVYEDFRIINENFFQEKAFFELQKLILFLKDTFEVILILTPRHENNFNNEYPKTKEALNTIENKVRILSNKLGIKLLGSYDPKKVKCDNDEFINDTYAKYSCLKKIKSMN